MVRGLNIFLRTAHIATMGMLLGGHAFHVAPERLQLTLWLAIGTGVVLAAVESGLRPLWLHQGRGLATLLKVALLLVVPLAWDQRLPILLAVVVIASIGSHMPGRFRYYSFVNHRVIHDGAGPGGGRAGETLK